MASEVIQFRERSEILDKLRKRRLNPNQVARQAFEAWVRRLDAEEQVAQLRRVRGRLPKPGAQLVREDRESH